MRNMFLIILMKAASAGYLFGQGHASDKETQAIHFLIDQYSQARENRDTALLGSILTTDVDQLVSTGEWRDGIDTALKGMLNSSATNPGTRKLTIERIRLINKVSAIVDCKYEIQNPDKTVRKMWSTFIILSEKGKWKITAIRNMLPSQ